LIDDSRSFDSAIYNARLYKNGYSPYLCKDLCLPVLQHILVPLAIPLIVGPGTISTAILYAAGAREDGTFLALLGVILVVSLIIIVCLLASQWILNVIGENVFRL